MHLFEHLVDVWGVRLLVDHVICSHIFTNFTSYPGKRSLLPWNIQLASQEPWNWWRWRSCQWWKWVWEPLKWMKAGCIKCSKNAVTNTNKILPSHTHTPILCFPPPTPNPNPHAPPSKAPHSLPHVPLSTTPTLILMLPLPFPPPSSPCSPSPCLPHFLFGFHWLFIDFHQLCHIARQVPCTSQSKSSFSVFFPKFKLTFVNSKNWLSLTCANILTSSDFYLTFLDKCPIFFDFHWLFFFYSASWERLWMSFSTSDVELCFVCHIVLLPLWLPLLPLSMLGHKVTNIFFAAVSALPHCVSNWSLIHNHHHLQHCYHPCLPPYLPHQPTYQHFSVFHSHGKPHLGHWELCPCLLVDHYLWSIRATCQSHMVYIHSCVTHLIPLILHVVPHVLLSIVQNCIVFVV